MIINNESIDNIYMYMIISEEEQDPILIDKMGYLNKIYESYKRTLYYIDNRHIIPDLSYKFNKLDFGPLLVKMLKIPGGFIYKTPLTPQTVEAYDKDLDTIAKKYALGIINEYVIPEHRQQYITKIENARNIAFNKVPAISSPKNVMSDPLKNQIQNIITTANKPKSQDDKISLYTLNRLQSTLDLLKTQYSIINRDKGKFLMLSLEYGNTKNLYEDHIATLRKMGLWDNVGNFLATVDDIKNNINLFKKMKDDMDLVEPVFSLILDFDPNKDHYIDVLMGYRQSIPKTIIAILTDVKKIKDDSRRVHFEKSLDKIEKDVNAILTSSYKEYSDKDRASALRSISDNLNIIKIDVKESIRDSTVSSANDLTPKKVMAVSVGVFSAFVLFFLVKSVIHGLIKYKDIRSYLKNIKNMWKGYFKVIRNKTLYTQDLNRLQRVGYDYRDALAIIAIAESLPSSKHVIDVAVKEYNSFLRNPKIKIAKSTRT